MKYLLNSAGIKNDSLLNALIDLLGKPIVESTAINPFPGGLQWPTDSSADQPPIPWRIGLEVEVVSEEHWKRFES